MVEQENTEMFRLLRLVYERMEIPIAEDAVVNTLQQRIKTARMVAQLNACMN